MEKIRLSRSSVCGSSFAGKAKKQCKFDLRIWDYGFNFKNRFRASEYEDNRMEYFENNLIVIIRMKRLTLRNDCFDHFGGSNHHYFVSFGVTRLSDVRR